MLQALQCKGLPIIGLSTRVAHAPFRVSTALNDKQPVVDAPSENTTTCVIKYMSALTFDWCMNVHQSVATVIEANSRLLPVHSAS